MNVIMVLLAFAGCAHTAAASANCYSDISSSNTATVVCSGLDGSNVNVLLDSLNGAVSATGGRQINVELRESNIPDLPTSTLTGYPIRYLSLYNNHLTSVPTNFLANVDPLLAILDLSQNDIAAIQSSDFSTLPFAASLQILQLALNKINALPPNLFLSLTNLQKLRLQFNLISSLVDDTFANLNEMTELQLYANEIGSVSVDAFGNLPKMRVLFLNGNSISTLENGTFSDLKVPALERIFLGNNPFICDCSLTWFKVWLVKRSLDVESDPTCVYPSFNPFIFVDFCPTDVDNTDGVLKDTKDAYLAYAEGVAMTDPRERKYRLSKLRAKLLATNNDFSL